MFHIPAVSLPGRSKAQLYLPLQRCHFGFELLEFLFLLPRTAGYFPQRGQILLQLFVLRPVLLHQFRNAVKRIEEIRCCRLVVGHCQLPVIVGVLVRPLDKEAVLFHLHTLTDGAFRFYKDRETVQLTDRQVFTSRRGVLGNLL